MSVCEPGLNCCGPTFLFDYFASDGWALGLCVNGNGVMVCAIWLVVASIVVADVRELFKGRTDLVGVRS
jgi:hypothetical protein